MVEEKEDGLLLGEREKARFAPPLMLLRDRHVKDEEEEGIERGMKAVIVGVRQAASIAAAAAAMPKCCFMFKPPVR